MDQPPLQKIDGLLDGPIGIILAPTRELAVQIHSDVRRFARVLDLRCVCVYGGAGVAQQISSLKAGAEIIVATPGRFIDILCANSGRVTNLRRVTFVVLDEADRMFDMGFAPQIMKVVENTRSAFTLLAFVLLSGSAFSKLTRLGFLGRIAKLLCFLQRFQKQSKIWPSRP